MILVKNVHQNEKSTYALRAQKKFDNFNFPFTLNPTEGCFFACKYCYSPIALCKQDKRADFFENIKVNVNKATILDKELNNYSNVLPQHLKRVQINETSDYYLPQVLNYFKSNGQEDLMIQILETFQNHWKKGNKWMLHILTKSPRILDHIDKLKEMKHMVQVEMSFATHDENIRKTLEFSAPSTSSRLVTIEKLAAEDIFVRVMAMPFYGGEDDLNKLKEITFKKGAKAFKYKELNYYDWANIKSLQYKDVNKLPRVSNRKDAKLFDVIVKSGEDFLQNGQPVKVKVLLPKFKQNKKDKIPDWGAYTETKNRLFFKYVNKIDCGYSELNKVDWKYIK